MKSLKNYSALIILSVFVFCMIPFKSSAKYLEGIVPGEKSFFSLLTASPGEEIYAQYGHTGIRFCDPDKRIDVAFNYGMFDFSSPNFAWRFVTGQTDYAVAAYSTFDFFLEYQMENRGITEQVLNLDQNEKIKLFNSLTVNIRPENRIYRYNFIYDNCSTMPRDMISKAVNGKINYDWQGEYKSLRDVIHHYTNDYPWVKFGIDFVLGAKADEVADLKSQQFAPDILSESFSKANIINESGKKPLVTEYRIPVQIDESKVEKDKFTPGPSLIMWLVFLATSLLTWIEYRKKKYYIALDAVLFTIAGLAGFVIAFLVFFSQHPTTEINYNLLWLHPIYLLFLPGLFFAKFRKSISHIFLAINIPIQFFALIGFLVFLPQSLNAAAYPFLLALLCRSLSNWIIYRNRD